MRLRVLTCRAGEIFGDAASAALFCEYERECANPLLGMTAPQQQAYERLEAAGFGQCFAVYADEELCGFAFAVAAELPHYGRKCATVESVFVARAQRGSGIGVALMEAVEAWAKEAGCAAIFYTAPAGSRMSRLLFLCGDRYTNTNHVFCRRLA